VRIIGKQVAALVLGLAITGCETTERVVPGAQTSVRHVNDPGERETREDVLLAAAEEHPDNPQVWWQLGDYYEAGQAWPECIAAYSHMKALIDDKAKRGEGKFTAGDYHLGRAYTLAKQYTEAVKYLGYVVKEQPEDIGEASINSHFRESHYLLGGIYFEHKQWKPARDHFVTFRELGGQPERVEPWLARIDQEEWSGDVPSRRAPRESNQRPPSAPNTPSAPAGGGGGR
jgi:hypothetical protein